ncbi:MAG: T9SS type A sorting domain-containing protein [Bacteroidales bacterium]|nr:T9SS type A sorting domain-containing protein [Bacteroidales bacterium]MCF8399533.1 T9SS type A sorting domain-containing protein [Bacteroidales bacterium]
MKKTITFIVLLLGMQCMIAQPVLNNNLNFAIGDYYRIDGWNTVNNIDPGGPGSNLVWDFEVVDGQDFFVGEAAICVDPAGTPFNDSAGATGANIAIKLFDSDEGPYQYYKSNLNSRELLAMGWYEAGNTSFTNYLSNYTDLQFPLNFGDDFDFNTELLMYSVDMGHYIMRDSGHVYIEADAWGSIVTPAESYSNVLRLKTTSVIHSWYKFDIGEPWLYLGEFTDISYNWYAPNIKAPVLTIFEFLFDKQQESMFSLHYLAEYDFPAGIESFENEHISLFPNPAKNHVNVLGLDQYLAEEIIIYDMHGREVLKQNVMNSCLDVSALRQGCYFVELRTKRKSLTRKLMIQ